MTTQEILDRLYGFVEHARRVGEIKDTLLYFKTFGNDAEVLGFQAQQQEELVAEVGRIYQEKMTPIVEEIASFLAEHPEELEEMLADA